MQTSNLSTWYAGSVRHSPLVMSSYGGVRQEAVFPAQHKSLVAKEILEKTSPTETGQRTDIARLQLDGSAID